VKTNETSDLKCLCEEIDQFIKMEAGHQIFERFKCNNSPLVLHYPSNGYHGTPSPADSGIMSPMTPLGSMTGSTPEHLTGFQASSSPFQSQSECHVANSPFLVNSSQSDDENRQHYYSEQDCQTVVPQNQFQRWQNSMVGIFVVYF
jgi:hypothetical protein